ncbi:hypothetical protein BA060_07480 [Brucella sp. B13-0095]|nr:hypothetical protein BA060_07480 [Brucella sp. B13-0095]
MSTETQINCSLQPGITKNATIVKLEIKEARLKTGGLRLLTNLGQGQNGLRFTERHRFKT